MTFKTTYTIGCKIWYWTKFTSLHMGKALVCPRIWQVFRLWDLWGQRPEHYVGWRRNWLSLEPFDWQLGALPFCKPESECEWYHCPVCRVYSQAVTCTLNGWENIDYLLRFEKLILNQIYLPTYGKSIGLSQNLASFPTMRLVRPEARGRQYQRPQNLLCKTTIDPHPQSPIKSKKQEVF